MYINRNQQLATDKHVGGKEMKIRTALVRSESGNLYVKRYDDYKNNKEFVEDLRANGFKVLKVWASDISYGQAATWVLLNRACYNVIV